MTYFFSSIFILLRKNACKYIYFISFVLLFIRTQVRILNHYKRPEILRARMKKFSIHGNKNIYIHPDITPGVKSG